MRFFPAILLLAALGCAPTRTYEVTIVNQASSPITVGVVKEGLPYQRDIASIDQWAIESPLDTLPAWGFVVPPGKTGDSPRYTGKFHRGSEATLRVYRGKMSNAELMAISHGSPFRLDIFLFPNVNNVVVIREADGKLQFVRVSPKPK